MPSLPGSQKARAFLEAIQAEVYAGLPINAHVEEDLSSKLAFADTLLEKRRAFMSADKFERFREDIRTHIASEFNAQLPTRYESRSYYTVMMTLADKINEAAKKLRMAIPITPLLGTLPTGRVNGMAISLDSQDYIVVFEHGLFAFANLLSKIIALAMRFKGTEEG